MSFSEVNTPITGVRKKLSHSWNRIGNRWEGFRYLCLVIALIERQALLGKIGAHHGFVRIAGCPEGGSGWLT